MQHISCTCTVASIREFYNRFNYWWSAYETLVQEFKTFSFYCLSELVYNSLFKRCQGAPALAQIDKAWNSWKEYRKLLTIIVLDSFKDKARLIYTKTLPFSLYKKLHDVLMLCDLEHSKYDLSFDTGIQFKKGSWLHSSIRSIFLKKKRLYKINENLF